MDLVSLLHATAERGSSDLHLSVGSPPMIRQTGMLQPLTDEILSAEECRDLVLSALTESQRSRLEEAWELDFVLEIQDVGRFRANAHYSRSNIEATFRVISKNIPSLIELGHRATLERICEREDGLILVTGSTGSGKTTTLASMIQTLNNTRSGVIVTVEDPVEYIFSNNLCLIKQREIGTDTHSFSAALRHVLRQDPDVIVISEMRDLETIQTAITAAETGHLVIATLHTIDAAKSIDRLVDVFPAEQQNQIVTQLSNSLQAIISQRLLPRIDTEGRVMATETLVANSAIRACIRDRKSYMIPGLIQIGSHDGMNLLDDSLLDLYKQGIISREEALVHARDSSRFPEPVVEEEPKKKKGFFS
ncbi:MAG: PilT/PilU family type 4a pilus ATPase [Verrucomicrobiota bacterium]